MILPTYLAMTSQEIAQFQRFSSTLCYFACHFSPTCNGLSDLPTSLPSGTILCLDDSVPVSDHCPKVITEQLQTLIKTLHPTGLLLDFQRPNSPAATQIIQAILERISCPVAVSHLYAEPYDCPVFAPPVPLRKPISSHLQPWLGREIWLELTADSEIVNVDEKGATVKGVDAISNHASYFRDVSLLCHYSIQIKQDSISFNICRTAEDLEELQNQARGFGVTKFIGLWQQLRQFYSPMDTHNLW